MKRSDRARRLVALSAAAVFLTVAACGTHTTMAVDGQVRAAKKADGTCDFTTPYHVGDEVVLRGADNSILAIDHLRVAEHTSAEASCDLAFHFDKVRPDDVAYQLAVGTSRPIVVTEDELRTKDFMVVPRGASHPEDPDFKVIAPPSPSPEPTH